MICLIYLLRRLLVILIDVWLNTWRDDHEFRIWPNGTPNLIVDESILESEKRRSSDMCLQAAQKEDFGEMARLTERTFA